jgi:hypothetical protein
MQQMRERAREGKLSSRFFWLKTRESSGSRWLLVWYIQEKSASFKTATQVRFCCVYALMEPSDLELNRQLGAHFSEYNRTSGLVTKILKAPAASACLVGRKADRKFTRKFTQSSRFAFHYKDRVLTCPHGPFNYHHF